jgi:hypothetical protein
MRAFVGGRPKRVAECQWSKEMRMFVILVSLAFAISSSFFASAKTSRGLSLGEPAPKSEQATLNSRCVKKVALGPDAAEIGCLMQKRKGRPV